MSSLFTFAGTISYLDSSTRKNDVAHIPQEWRKIVHKTENRVILYISGETEVENSTLLLDFLGKHFTPIDSYDISHTGDELDGTKDHVRIYSPPIKSGKYTLTVLHGTDFETILNQYPNPQDILSIRTAELSKPFGKPVIKIDFLQ